MERLGKEQRGREREWRRGMKKEKERGKKQKGVGDIQGQVEKRGERMKKKKERKRGRGDIR